MSDLPQVRLVREARVRDLLPDGGPHRLEASGVLTVGRRFYVIFDNLRAVAMIDQDLDRTEDNALVPTGSEDRQAYEDIAADPAGGHLYLLIEAARHRDGYQARVEEYDMQLRCVSAGWLEFPLPGLNKGMEGLACVRRDGVPYLLGLCEGNLAEDGAAGRRPGGGRVVVFRRSRRNWKHEATIDLPRTLPFIDYSGLSVEGDRIAVISQESSALWLGRFVPGTWQLAGTGCDYAFPRTTRGDIVYPTMEGVCLLPPHTLVVVSDRAKAGAPRPGPGKEESLHIFALPPGAPGTDPPPVGTA